MESFNPEKVKPRNSLYGQSNDDQRRVPHPINFAWDLPDLFMEGYKNI